MPDSADKETEMFGKRVKILLILMAAPALIGAGIDLGTVIVTGTRVPHVFADRVRTVTVIEKEMIASSPARSIAELLTHSASLDLRERGAFGVQSDISMRGATFEQVLILVDGVRMNDSQTAHHNMDLPVSLSDIEKIEVIRGHASSVYGPDAFGGVVNIITKRPAAKSVRTELESGSYGTVSGKLAVEGASGGIRQYLSASGSRSDGYSDNNDYDITNLFGRSVLNPGGTEMDISYGLKNNSFGANNFYGTVLDKERERTSTRYVSLKTVTVINDGLALRSGVAFKRHSDIFSYDYSGISYLNDHLTDRLDLNLSASARISEKSSVAAGGELITDTLDSSNMGERRRRRTGLFIENRSEIADKLLINAGIRGDNHSSWGWQIAPSLGLGWKLNEKIKLRSSVGKAFREPSYTDLYYKTPSNLGDPALKPETALSCDAGLDWLYGAGMFGLTLFAREEANIIDWIKEDPSDTVWLARNIGNASVRGIEMNARQRIGLLTSGIAYTYTDKEAESAYISKYALRQPVHQISSVNTLRILENLGMNISFSYRKRPSEEGYLLTNCSLTVKSGKAEFYIKGTNIFDEKYNDIVDVQGYPLWLGAGVNYNF